MVWNPNAYFYKLNNQLFFCELFNDTIFHVTANSLTPKYIFNMGKYSAPYAMRTAANFESEKYFFLKGIFESSKYLFCTFSVNKKTYTALYDKAKKTCVVNVTAPESGNGVINNSNDFVPFELSSMNEANELICTMDAFKIVQWFKNNPGKVNKLPQNLKGLQNVKETDNPVIVIVKLKE
jgi:hypothetical protein